jgi:acetate kinase
VADLNILVVNAGSSSLKLSVLSAEDDAVVAARTIETWEGDDTPLEKFLGEIGAVDAVGHRVVHGGVQFTTAVRVDDGVRNELETLVPLAPLHQPRSLAAIDAARRVLPDTPQIACFDTAFHAGMPPAATTYALPAEWRSRWPVRRFGFHGLAHAYASRRAAEILGLQLETLRMVTCHLGAGASLCAIAGGESVDTTMGFTPLEGLVMATRSGTVDPGLVLWLAQQGGLSVDEVADGLERRSGLLGLCGAADMREVLSARAQGDPDAALAFAVYTRALRRELGAMVAVLDGVEVIVFSGGVGEHSREVRTAVRLPIDPAKNASTVGDGDISAEGADVRAVVVTAREDVEIARQVRDLV